MKNVKCNTNCREFKELFGRHCKICLNKKDIKGEQIETGQQNMSGICI